MDDEAQSPSVFEAIEGDERLSSNHKKVLMDMYRALVEPNGSVSPKTNKE
jgi:hypothetical protein